MNRINEILKTISEWVNDIKQGLADDVRKKSINSRSQMRLGWINDLFEPTLKEERCRLGDCLASEGAAKPFTEYIRILTDNGWKEPDSGSDDAKDLYILKSMCWNYSDVSLDFCYELGKTGLFRILVAHLDRCKGSLETATEEEENHSLHATLSIFHNCAKETRNRPFFKQARVIEALLPYTRMKNKNLIFAKMVAILAMSYLVEEDTQNEIAVDKPILYIIVYFLRKTVAVTDHKFNGFSAKELVEGLKNLADHDQNKGPILDAGILPLLENLLETGDVSEKTIAAETIWSLCFADENRSKILESGKMMRSLEKLGKRPGELGHFTSGALWFLKSQKSSQASLQNERSRRAASGSTQKQIMISYSSREKILALKVKARLERLKCRVWMDMDGSEGTNFEGTKKALENSDAFILCVSHDYKTRPSCRMEAEYAQKLKIPMFPILAEFDYKTSGWLGAMQGSKTCIDFSDPATFDNSFAKLVKEIQKEFGVLKSSTPGQTGSPSERSVEKWSSKEVMDWATENKLAQTHFLNVDGASLAYLRDMKKDSPEFYHKYVVEKLELSDLQDLKNLSRGLENLKL